MSIYATPLSQLGPADLQELLDGAAIENIRLEFKLLIPNKDETLKKISSFANTYGGFVVIGAKANSADGRIEELPGVDVEAGYKQKVVQWSFDGASPPLVVGVSDPIPTPSGKGKVCYVVSVAESDVAPHFLNGRKGIWVRTDEFSARFEAHLADENELRHLFDRRKLILERRAMILDRARKRFDSCAGRTHTDRGGNRTPLGSRLELCVVPRFPSRQVRQQEELKALVQKSSLSWRQVMFPDPGSAILSQHESAIVLNAARGTSIFEVNTWGMLFYGTKVDRDYNGALGIHLHAFVGYLLVFIQHAGKMLQALGYVGPIHVEMALDSLLGTRWLNPQLGGFFAERPGSALDDDVRLSLDTTSEALLDQPDGVVIDLLRYVFFAVNWSGLVETQEKLENLVRVGHEFSR